MNPAKPDTTAKTTTVNPAIHGSFAFTPYNSADTYCPNPIADGTPTASPIPNNTSTSRITSHNTAPGCAPSAIRTPNSFVRRATTNAITPYNPTAASRVANIPNPADNNAISRSVNNRWSNWSPSVFNSYTGIAASKPFTAPRTAPYTEADPIPART